MTKQEKRKLNKLYVAAKARYIFCEEQVKGSTLDEAEEQLKLARKNFVRVIKLFGLFDMHTPILRDDQALAVYNRWLYSECDSWYDQQWGTYYLTLL